MIELKKHFICILLVIGLLGGLLCITLYMSNVESYSNESKQKNSDDKLSRQYAMNPRLSEDSKKFIGGVPTW